MTDLPMEQPPQPDPAVSGDPGPPEAAAAESAPGPGPAVTVLEGRVSRVTADRVHVCLADGRQGAVPLIEFAGQLLPKESDPVRVIIDREDPATGELLLSKRQADEATFWESVKPGDVLEGVVTGMNRGGLDIDLGGARAFLPGPQVDTRRIKDISTLIGEHLRCVVTQVDRTTRDIIVSRRKLLERERKEKRASALAAMKEGEIRAGTVRSLTDYGAFVDVGGVEGLLHVTDISWGRVQRPDEVLREGQEIEVCVIKINRETGKVSLGLKQTRPDPWIGIEQRYAVGSRVKARVLRFADFGAFVELEEGVEALLPVSELSWSRRVTHPSEILRLGDEIELAVLRVEEGRRRISLGLKQTEENPWDRAAAELAPNARVKGKVVRITEFGAFVELFPGVEGLVHISELSDHRVKTVGDVVREGQEVEVRVLKTDRQAQRISLSMRPEPQAAPPPAAEAKKKRKRPLRGGLSSHFEW